MGTTAMFGDLDDLEWKALADSVRSGECTPFLGAGAGMPTLPSGVQLARELAVDFGYPLSDREDLTRVVQFLALRGKDVVFPKREILKRLKERGYPVFAGNEPHYVLASLNLPVYLTTNYDDFMVKALDQVAGKKARRDYCRWTPDLAAKPNFIWKDTPAYQPNAGEPVVYHLHGCDLLARSLVVTEDDYLEFMYNIAKSGSVTKTVDRPWEMFPPPIMNAISNHSLIFLGYRLTDWDFRIIFRWLVLSLGRTQTRVKVAVQLRAPDRQGSLAEMLKTGGLDQPVKDEDLTVDKCLELIGLLERQRLNIDEAIAELWRRHAKISGKAPRDGRSPVSYLDEYFRDIFQVSVFWGTAEEFVSKLKKYLADDGPRG
jgi:hypothetical protein